MYSKTHGFHCPHCGAMTYMGMCKNCNKNYTALETGEKFDGTTHQFSGNAGSCIIKEEPLDPQVRQRIYG